jgi:hypothetical protein
VIYVARPRYLDDVIEALSKPFSNDGLTEIQRARKYYETNPPPRTAYPFKRYKEPPVCIALDSLFHEKCAYCESTYRAVDSRDVEHFRPKGGVTEAPHHPGYWWLAADWSNLLPSCPPCNQKRRQLAYEQSMTMEEFERARRNEPKNTSGKGNSFPVRERNWVTKENGNTNCEDPLLINPCERQPDKHLEWTFDWNKQIALWNADPITAFLRPRFRNDTEDPYGKASIAVYGLNRAGLFRERMERIKEMQVLLRIVVDVIIKHAGTRPGSLAWANLSVDLANHRKEFQASFTHAKKPYAGMGRAFLAKFDAELSQFF